MMSYIGPLCVIIIIFTAMIYYIIHRLFAIFGLNESILITCIIAVILGIILSVSFFLSRYNKILDIIGVFAGWLFVLAFLLFVLLLIENIISIRYHTNPRIIIGIMIIIFGAGTYFALSTKITELNIKSDKISQDTKILFVTDIHVDNIMSSIHLNKLKETIQSENPDFVIIGGDLLNQPNEDYIKYFSILDDVNVPIYAIMGNHDVMGDSSVINSFASKSNIHFLFNDSIEIEGIQLIGIIDKSIRGNSNVTENIDKTNYKNDSDLFTIFLTHQPISLEKIKDYPIDLELAGHTHNGQFIGAREIAHIANDYGYGEYNEGKRIAFVSQGIGTRGLPFRLGTQSEIVIINLSKS